jgi:V/A-type H+-transporting ATPase subunit I
VGWLQSTAALGGILGLIGVMLFAALEHVALVPSDRRDIKSGVRAALRGLLALTDSTKLFGDVLSYLRLFALGLASAALGAAFNDLASQVHNVKGLGIALAALVLLVGHALNMALCIVGGLVHGLRLNVIEFFNWGLSDEGFAFQPLEKKEKTTWNS